MRFNNVAVRAITYELPAERVHTASLEALLEPVYNRLKVPLGQLELLTGIAERRFWPRGTRVAAPATRAAEAAISKAGMTAQDLDLVIYAGVCRDEAEPATATAVGAALGVRPEALLYDVSNACLGMLSGVLDAAIRVEAGYCRRALVVATESARAINEEMIATLLENQGDRALFNAAIATLTGGSGAAAIIVSSMDDVDSTPHGVDGNSTPTRLLGAAWRNAAGHHELCRWAFEPAPAPAPEHQSATPAPSSTRYRQMMRTDAVNVLKHGVELGVATWRDFLALMEWQVQDIDRVISHQIGKAHRRQMLAALGIAEDLDVATFPLLGNVGSVSVPLTAALAAERKKLVCGDRVAWLGIGSGLNCLMLGLLWGSEGEVR